MQYALETSDELVFVDLTVTSKSNEDTLPIETRCWISTGAEDIDLEDSYMSVLASVTQGGSPVIHATVE